MSIHSVPSAAGRSVFGKSNTEMSGFFGSACVTSVSGPSPWSATNSGPTRVISSTSSGADRRPIEALAAHETAAG
jgi:hypothetical protein